MTDRLDLPSRYREDLKALLREHVPDAAVWAYGSRVNGRSHDGSDLDLVLRSPTLEPLGCEYLELVEALEQSNIPILVQVHDWARLPESFHREIERDYVVVQKGDHQTAMEGWRKVALGGVCSKIGSGATPRGGKDVYLDEGPYTLIRSQNVYNDGFHRDGLAFIGEGHASELQNVEVFEGDVLLNITGDSVARVCQVAQDVLPARVNQHVAIIRPDSVNLDAGYLRYYLTSPEMQALLLSWAGSGGTRNALTKGMIESLEIPLPPLPQQRRIAHILGTLDDKIELNRQMNETLEEMARAIFQDWFVDFGPVRAKLEGRDPYLPAELWALFPDWLVDSELGEMPEGWEVKALGDCINVARGLSYKGSGLSSDGMPMHNLNSIYEGGGYKDDGIKFYDGDFQDRHVTEPGDVIVANTEQGHDRLLIGFAAIVPKRFGDRGLFSHHIYRVRPKGSAGLSRDFVCHLLNNLATHGTVSGYATGTTVNMLPVDALRIPRMVVPPTPLVAAFSAAVQENRMRQEILIEESRALAAQRDALLPKLVRGELRTGSSHDGLHGCR